MWTRVQCWSRCIINYGHVSICTENRTGLNWGTRPNFNLVILIDRCDRCDAWHTAAHRAPNCCWKFSAVDVARSKIGELSRDGHRPSTSIATYRLRLVALSIVCFLILFLGLYPYIIYTGSQLLLDESHPSSFLTVNTYKINSNRVWFIQRASPACSASFRPSQQREASVRLAS